MGYLTPAEQAEQSARAAGAQAKGNAAPAAPQPVDPNAALAAHGYSIGNVSPTHETAQTNETDAQRYYNKQSNFAYGMSPDAAARQVGEERRALGMAAQPSIDLGQGAQGTSAAMLARGTPTTNFAMSDASRANEQAAYRAMLATGQQPGPSAAQQQLAAGTAQAQANQLALAQSGRGMGSTASAGRQAAFANAGIEQNAQNQGQILAAQEDQAMRQRQLAAFGQAGEMAGQMRGEDTGQAQYLTQAELAARAQNNQTALGYGQAAEQAYAGAAHTAMSQEELANQINAGSLQGTMGYEQNVQNYALAPRAPKKEAAWKNWARAGLVAGGAVAGTFVSPGAGTVGGAAVGAAAANQIK